MSTRRGERFESTGEIPVGERDIIGRVEDILDRFLGISEPGGDPSAQDAHKDEPPIIPGLSELREGDYHVRRLTIPSDERTYRPWSVEFATVHPIILGVPQRSPVAVVIKRTISGGDDPQESATRLTVPTALGSRLVFDGNSSPYEGMLRDLVLIGGVVGE